MARALSLDLRERMVATIEEGASCRQAAERFGVGKASAIRWHARYRAEGESAVQRHPEVTPLRHEELAPCR